mgnify:CR=1 FL=1
MKNGKRKVLLGVLIVLVLCIGLFMENKTNTLNTSSISKESITKELDNNLIGAYIQNGDDYTSTDEIPTSGYEFNAEKSYCKIGDVIQDGATLSYDMDTQTLTVSPITKEGMKCYLYFDESAAADETILAHYQTVLTRTSFSSTVTNTTTGTIYKSANESQYDDFGEVYYFAGKPTDNWFYFGGYYWRIVRINGDGSVRLIYNGTSTNQTGNSTMINTRQAFNSSYNNNMYVGYMYTQNEVHGLTTNSSIKTVLDNWYLSNLADEAEYLDGNAGFCGDRTPYSGSGTGTSNTNYGAYNRLYTNKAPTFKCTDKDNDLYTTPGSSEGNGALKVTPSDNDSPPTPIGLITADEVAFAGGVNGSSNSSYYLYNNAHYWTMSPSHYNGSNGALVFVVYSNGYLDWNGVDWSDFGVRPAINIRADVSLTGSGTTSDPFKVAGA